MLNLRICVALLIFSSGSFVPCSAGLPEDDNSVSTLNETTLGLVDLPSVVNVLQDQKSAWGWHPWQSAMYSGATEYTEHVCKNNSILEDFPDDLFTHEQRLQGAVILHMLGAIYFFTVLAVVCNDYFIPSIECICEDLQISTDVAAATFMAVSGTIPEFFTNLISTFVTDSDMGLGAIIGSLFFNTLGVAACAGLATRVPVKLPWYPIIRDCSIFSINVAILVALSWDGRIEWYEGMILTICAVLYWILLFQNDKMRKFAYYYLDERWHCCRTTSYDLEEPDKFKKVKGPDKNATVPAFHSNDDPAPPDTPTPYVISGNVKAEAVTKGKESKNDDLVKKRKSLWRIPHQSKAMTVWWFYTWPIKLLTTCFIPSPKTFRRLYPLTFVMCILFIGVNSYLVFWMVAVIGTTFGIPEVVMGLTILAWGSCTPEAAASIIVLRKGSGGVGVSQSLGSNSMAILISLGVPWFLRTLVDGAWSNEKSYVNIYSHGISYVIMALILAALSLFLVLHFVGYRLKKTSGLILLAVYGVFITLAVLQEMNIIFPTDYWCP